MWASPTWCRERPPRWRPSSATTFVYSLTFISSVGRMTVSVGVPVALIRGDVYYWRSLMAACLITGVPLAILYNFFLDRFIAGITIR